MSRHLPLTLITLFCMGFISLHMVISAHILAPAGGGEGPMVTARDKPDFAAIKPVPKRKQAFFSFLDTYIEQRNTEILALRARIESNQVSDSELLKLAKRYRIKSEDPAIIRQRLLIKVDAIPPSLVMAQGAMESAWGTSRFAVEGNNYFGQWCFREGCGMVPELRHEEKNHEVRLFQSPQASVNSYMLNLNSHPAYRDLRKARAELRAQNASLNGCYLAQGLEHYSEKGTHYVEVLKKLIRVNKLEADPKGHCAPVLLAEDKDNSDTTPEAAPQPGDKPRDMAADDTQSKATPQPAETPPPAG